MLFKILHIRNMVRDGVNDPEAFAEAQATEAFIGALILPVVITLGFLAFLFVLAYTGWLGGPYGIAKFFFWLVAIIYTVVGYTFYKVVTTLKKAVKAQREHFKQAYQGGGSNYREAEVVKDR